MPGITENKRFIIIQIWKFKFVIYRTKKLDRVSIHLCEHCNLNCKNCDNFSPIAGQEFPDTDKLCRDILQLSKITSSDLPELIFTGGEPLLNNDISKILHFSRKVFPDTKISVVTNGILLFNRDESFWQTFREDKIVVAATKYPIKLDYKKIEEKCINEKVQLEYFNDANTTKTSFHMPFDLNGRKNIRKNLINCYHYNNCVQMYHGKLFNCSIAANVKHFNKYFHQNLPENGFIDVYKVKTKRQLEKQLKKPVSLCRYCNISGRTFNNEWGISHKNIKEWT